VRKIGLLDIYGFEVFEWNLDLQKLSVLMPAMGTSKDTPAD
jgi:hypothetical protein